MKINNGVDNCNFILGIQVALKTFVSVVPFLLIFFRRSHWGKTPWPPLRTPLFESLATVSYSHSIVTMALSFIISEIK